MLEYIAKLTEGNPGAATVLAQLSETSSTMFGVCMGALWIQEITGCLIWVCYKDICNQDIQKFKDMLLDGSLLNALKETKEYEYYKSK